MSLKAIELQIAIPKTFDAGKIADNHQQNVINQQHHANEALKRDIERKQLAVNETDELDNLNEDGERNASDQSQSLMEKDRKNKKEEKPARHPFKGNFIDYSG